MINSTSRNTIILGSNLTIRNQDLNSNDHASRRSSQRNIRERREQMPRYKSETVSFEGTVSIFSRRATAPWRGAARNETPVRSIIKTMIAQWIVRGPAATVSVVISHFYCGPGDSPLRSRVMRARIGKRRENALARSSLIKVGYYLHLRRLATLPRKTVSCAYLFSLFARYATRCRESASRVLSRQKKGSASILWLPRRGQRSASLLSSMIARPLGTGLIWRRQRWARRVHEHFCSGTWYILGN